MKLISGPVHAENSSVVQGGEGKEQTDVPTGRSPSQQPWSPTLQSYPVPEGEMAGRHLRKTRLRQRKAARQARVAASREDWLQAVVLIPSRMIKEA